MKSPAEAGLLNGFGVGAIVEIYRGDEFCLPESGIGLNGGGQLRPVVAAVWDQCNRKGPALGGGTAQSIQSPMHVDDLAVGRQNPSICSLRIL